MRIAIYRQTADGRFMLLGHTGPVINGRAGVLADYDWGKVTHFQYVLEPGEQAFFETPSQVIMREGDTITLELPKHQIDFPGSMPIWSTQIMHKWISDD